MAADRWKITDHRDNMLLTVDKIAYFIHVVWDCGVFAIRGVFLGVDCWTGEKLEVIRTERGVIYWFERGLGPGM